MADLKMTFITDENEKDLITIKDMRDDVMLSEVTDLINLIISSDVFIPKIGTKLTEISSVDLVITTINKLI